MSIRKSPASFPALLTMLILAMLIGPAIAPAQTTYYVDDDAPGDPGPGDPEISDPDEDGSAGHPFDAIQEGIDAAAEGDTVRVTDGTYTGTGNRAMDFSGKAIAVISAGGPTACIVDCGGASNAFTFGSGEGLDSVLAGFTVRNGGNIRYGGGIKCLERSSPTIRGNVFTANTAQRCGGGIYCASEASPLITGNVITENVSRSGGGLFCNAASPIITGNTITANDAYFSGGGLYLSAASPLLVNNLLTDNTSGADGGGLVCADNASPLVMNCTFTGNLAAGNGGAVYCCSASAPELENCILWGDGAAAGIEIHVGASVCERSRLLISHTDLQGGPSAVTREPGCRLVLGSGMFEADPLFTAGPLGGHYLSQTASGQAQNSPCLDAGSAAAGTICFTATGGPVCMDTLTTRTDHAAGDTGVVDMGYHYDPAGPRAPITLPGGHAARPAAEAPALRPAAPGIGPGAPDPQMGSVLGRPRLLCVGDSLARGITGSVDRYGFRSKLQDKLGICRYDFVGPFNDPCPCLPDAEHECTHAAHGGLKTAILLDSLPGPDGWLERYLPLPNPPGSLVILHVGSMDIYNGVPLEQAVANMLEAIRLIDQHDPTLEIHVALILPSAILDMAPLYAQYNGMLGFRIHQAHHAGMINLHAVDIYSAFLARQTWVEDYMYDVNHPNDAGYQVMADAFAASILAP